MTTSMYKNLGSFNEKELMSADYVESPESGQAGYSRIYDSTQFGWTRRTTVRIVLNCWKSDLKTVLDALPTNPTNLTSVAGKNSDGTEATRLQWGAGYELKDARPQYISPSIVKLSCTYSKDAAEAQDVKPDELTIVCSAGVYTVRWQTVVFKTFDTGTGVCGTTGLVFAKSNQEKRRCTVTTADDETPHVNMTVQNKDRWYNVLKVYCDSVLTETLSVLAKEIVTGTETTSTYDAAEIGEVVHETTYLGTIYAADLYWAVSGNQVRLYWSGAAVWDFEN